MRVQLSSTHQISKSSISSKSITQQSVDAGIHQKALDIKALDMSTVSDVADYFVVMSGTSTRHVQGIVDRIKQFLERSDEFPISVSGYENAQWVLLDYGDVVIHVFLEEARHYYSVDELWHAASAVNWPLEIAEQLDKLRTGLYQKFHTPDTTH